MSAGAGGGGPKRWRDVPAGSPEALLHRAVRAARLTPAQARLLVAAGARVVRALEAAGGCLVRAFVLARVVCGERGAGGLTTGELWGAFQSWREENAGAPLTRRQFAVRVRRLLADEFGVGQRCSLKRGGRSARGFSRLQLSDPGRTSLV